MNFHKTESAKIGVPKPKNTRGWTTEQIIAYGREHYNTNIETGRPMNKFTAYMVAVSNAIFNPEDWKAPIYAIFPGCGNEWAKAAIIWYHGAQPYESFVGVYSHGYAC